MLYKSYIISGIYKWKSFQINLPFYRFKTGTENLSDYPKFTWLIRESSSLSQNIEAPKKEAYLPI